MGRTASERLWTVVSDGRDALVDTTTELRPSNDSRTTASRDEVRGARAAHQGARSHIRRRQRRRRPRPPEGSHGFTAEGFGWERAIFAQRADGYARLLWVLPSAAAVYVGLGSADLVGGASLFSPPVLVALSIAACLGLLVCMARGRMAAPDDILTGALGLAAMYAWASAALGLASVHSLVFPLTVLAGGAVACRRQHLAVLLVGTWLAFGLAGRAVPPELRLEAAQGLGLATAMGALLTAAQARGLARLEAASLRTDAARRALRIASWRSAVSERAVGATMAAEREGRARLGRRMAARVDGLLTHARAIDVAVLPLNERRHLRCMVKAAGSLLDDVDDVIGCSPRRPVVRAQSVPAFTGPAAAAPAGPANAGPASDHDLPAKAALGHLHGEQSGIRRRPSRRPPAADPAPRVGPEAPT